MQLQPDKGALKEGGLRRVVSADISTTHHDASFYCPNPLLSPLLEALAAGRRADHSSGTKDEGGYKSVKRGFSYRLCARCGVSVPGRTKWIR